MSQPAISLNNIILNHRISILKMPEIQVSIKEPTWTNPFFCNTFQIQTSFPSEFAISNAWARQSSLASLSPCCALNTCGYRSTPGHLSQNGANRTGGNIHIHLDGRCIFMELVVLLFLGANLAIFNQRSAGGCGEGRTISCWPIMIHIYIYHVYTYMYIMYIYNHILFYCKNIHNLQEFCLGFKICSWFQIHGDSAERDSVIWIHLALGLSFTSV